MAAALPFTSMIARARSLVPSALKRKVPSTPAKPEGLVKVNSAKRCVPYWRVSAAAREMAS